ncbi:ankyrin repeat domain-containing protein 1-like [Gigantopelta aegis]|uniref:ankyrin repeat domain-containing protein 1-like n=1 Tax=Gigantopelta aegis TaxID=1735272 RepID=UPI001B888F09|nr:ankyrin repeat domain-containing protein 1-like [Gigantopelta aegis]
MAVLLQRLFEDFIVEISTQRYVIIMENYRFLAERLTNELKGTRHVEDETNVPNIRNILSHPSFKDEEFVNFLTEIVWNNDVPAEILNQKLDAQQLDVEVAFTKDTLEKTWKADPNVTDADKKSPLHFAVCNREENVVENLIHHGAKLDNVDEFGNILLHIASKEGSLQTVSYLMDMKSEEILANDDIMSLFNLAVEHNTEDVA